MQRLQDAGQPIAKLIVRAVHEGRLDNETQRVIRDKWLVMDSIINVAARHAGAKSEKYYRRIVDW